MSAKKISILLFILPLFGCIEEKDNRTPVEQLTYEELEAVYKDCDTTGKLATDDYCKQAAHVYVKKRSAKLEEARLKKAKKINSYPKAPF